jgi:hypothetical protein
MYIYRPVSRPKRMVGGSDRLAGVSGIFLWRSSPTVGYLLVFGTGTRDGPFFLRRVVKCLHSGSGTADYSSWTGLVVIRRPSFIHSFIPSFRSFIHSYPSTSPLFIIPTLFLREFHSAGLKDG